MKSIYFAQVRHSVGKREKKKEVKCCGLVSLTSRISSGKMDPSGRCSGGGSSEEMSWLTPVSQQLDAADVMLSAL